MSFKPSLKQCVRPHLCEFDLFLVDHLGRSGTAPPIHQPPAVSHQNHIRLLDDLGEAACQRVSHLVLQGSSVGVHLEMSRGNWRVKVSTGGGRGPEFLNRIYATNVKKLV